MLRASEQNFICCLLIKVIQKSYGNRKRYLRPPIFIHPLGNGWRHRQEEMLRKGESPQGIQLCAFIGIENSGQHMQQLNINYNKQCFAAETLPMSDLDKRKEITL